MLNKSLVFQILIHGVYLLVVYILQALVMPYLPLFGVSPVILPLAAVGVGMFEGSRRGAVFGLFAGMFCDASFNQPTALFTIVVTIIGLFVGILSDSIMARGFPSYLLCSLGALLIAGFCQSFSLIFFRNASTIAVLLTLVRQTLYSVVFTVPLYFVSRAVGRSAPV